MEQHPIPQNISSYEFRLVGDMTLKQFLQLAGGIVVGIVIFRLPLPAFVRYPLVFASVVMGITLAFVPINGRPFARYVWVFLMAIYSPTEFLWRHVDQVTPTATSPAQSASTTPSPQPVNPSSQPTGPLIQSPNPTSTAHPIATEAPLVTPAEDKNTQVFSSSQTTSAVVTPQASEPTPQPSVVEPETTPANTVSVPDTESPVAQAIFQSDQPSPDTNNINPAELTIARTDTSSAKNAAYTDSIVQPEYPNILTGLVTTVEGNGIENAIIEIIEASSGIPARALRTNRLGQFQIATPLSNGSYTIQTEKTGLQFEPVRIEAKGQIIDPIIIQPVA